jgi:diguanylate cyclase (GGDEF)-like protein
MSDEWTSRFLPSTEEVTPLGTPRAGGQTTLVQRVLERRAERRTKVEEGTMLRLLPPPEALLAIHRAQLKAEAERRSTSDLLEVESTDETAAAPERFAAEFRPVIVTDDLELVRKFRARQGLRTPFVLFVAELDESAEREIGLAAGADECIGRRAGELEWDARLATMRRVAELQGVLSTTLEENRKLSATDDLTRVASRRFFGKHFPREVEWAARHRRPLSLVLCDIDHFKNINDTLGHAGGDDILRQFGLRLQNLLRAKADWVARIGGEEFAIVLPEIPCDAAREVARKLRAFVAHTPFNAQGKRLRVTASFGVCGFEVVPFGDRKTAERMLKAADAALYRSKHDGRNRVTLIRGLADDSKVR